MDQYPNVLIIAGTGRNSGKTTTATSIIEKFSDLGVVGVKISPHFHTGAKELSALVKGENYNIYIENHIDTGKDSARMRKAGAATVYYVEVNDKGLKKAFSEIMKIIPASSPVVCESPALRKVVVPGVFLIVDGPHSINKKQDVLDCKGLADKYLNTEQDRHTDIADQLVFDTRGWSLKA